MSGRLVSSVLDSALPAWLKPYAVAFASFAAPDGSKVYPSIARVAKMVGRSDRRTQAAAAELRRRGVLLVELGPGRYRAIRYRFNRSALPTISDGTQLQLFQQAPLLHPGANPEISDVFHSHAQGLTGRQRHPMGDASVSRSVTDPPVVTSNRRKV